MLGSDNGIILVSIDDKLLGSTLGAAHRITLRLDEGTELGSPYGSFDGSNEFISEVSFLSESIGSDNETALGSFDGAIDDVLEESALGVLLGYMVK